MDNSVMLADLFGAARRDSLTLKRPVESLRAVQVSVTSAKCDGIAVISPKPIQALCGALMSSGVPDAPMQVVDTTGAAVIFVESIHQAAHDGMWPT